MPGEAGVDLANLRPQVNRVNGVGTPVFSSEPESNLPRCSFYLFLAVIEVSGRL